MRDEPQSRVFQRLIDPEVCSSCYGCYETCPKGAVVVGKGQLAIDPALCNDCKACVAECSTGAIEAFRLVPPGACYSIDEQLEWIKLPPAEL